MRSPRSIGLKLLVAQVTLSLFLAAAAADERLPLAALAVLAALTGVSGLLLARRELGTQHAALAVTSDRARHARPALGSTLPQAQELETVRSLAGGVARHFNNLLTVIGASTSLAERAVASGACPLAELEQVRLAVGRASELTRQLSDLARRRSPFRRELELNELLAELELSLARALGADKQLRLELSGEPLRVLGDRAQLEQALTHLVLNARDALLPGGTLCIATSRDDENARVELRDNGAGISEEAQPHLFEPFFTTKSPGCGTGLGLTSCLGILRQHDGTIRIESALGHGTVIRIALPLATGSESGVTTSGVVELAPKRPRVLVTEDEPQVRAVAVRSLSGAGFEVLEASSGARGLAVFRARSAPIDVLVTDVVMPELSGPELARAVRALDPGVGLVFMSGYPESMSGARVSEFEGAAFLSKPFTPKALVEAVRERIDQQRARLRDHG